LSVSIDVLFSLFLRLVDGKAVILIDEMILRIAGNVNWRWVSTDAVGETPSVRGGAADKQIDVWTQRRIDGQAVGPTTDDDRGYTNGGASWSLERA